MSKKESNYQLIESLIKQNSALYETIGELQNIAFKYDTLVQALDDAITSDADGAFLMRGRDILEVYKSLEPYHYSHMISDKQKDQAGES